MSQAAACLIDAEPDCATYRQRLADHTRCLADLLPETDCLPDDQTTSTTAAWALSIDRANQRQPAGPARPMLELAAMPPEAHSVLYPTCARLGATGQVTTAATHFRHLADTVHTRRVLRTDPGWAGGLRLVIDLAHTKGRFMRDQTVPERPGTFPPR